jgi:uncharacterized delta-60 repeat protein
MLLLATALPASAAPGDPDPTFGTGGVTSTDVSGSFDIANGVLVQPNGKIVAVGQATFGTSFSDANFGVARYLSNGDPDTTFSGDGIQNLDFSADGDIAEALAKQGKNKLVVVGTSQVSSTESDLAVARFTKNGSPDPNFSGDGKTRMNFSGASNSNGRVVAVRADGRILAAGSAFFGTPHLRGGGGQTDFAIARFRPNGTLDPAFGGGDGQVTTDFAGATDFVQAIARLGSGDFLVAGTSQTPSFEQRIAVAEYLPNGTLDPAFSGDGKVVVNMVPGESETVAGLVVRPDGKILVGVSARNGVSASSQSDIGLLLLRPDGTIATSFGGGDGKVFQDFGGSEDPSAMARDSNGKLVFVSVAPTSPQATWVFRLTAVGGKDAGFGTGGRVELDDASGIGGFAIAVDASNRPVVAGRVGTGAGADFTVARFQA